MPLKNPVESLSARNAAGSRPAARARRSVVGSTKAPAGSSGPAAAAVGAVGIGGQRRNAGGAVEVDGERQSVFLVGPAAALAAQRDRELAAGENDHPAALGAQITGQTGVFRRHLPGLALQAVAEHHAFVAGRNGALLRRPQCIGRPRHDPIVGAGKDLVAGLRRLVFRIVERLGHGGGQIEPETGHDGAGGFESRRVGHGRPGTDDGRVVAGHVGDRQRYQLGGKSEPGEAAALDAREMLCAAYSCRR